MDPHKPVCGTEDERIMMALLRRMLAAGVSRWADDPLAELAKEGRAAIRALANPLFPWLCVLAAVLALLAKEWWPG